MSRQYGENHRVHRASWLRAMVLGANDGIVSTACLLLGVAAASADPGALLVTGLAGLVAGALSMAVGELVSVASQRDTELADIAIEKRELQTMPQRELEELVSIYVDKGLTPTMAREVAVALTAKDALGTHMREELGITDETMARPVQAAVSSAISFALGAAMPLITIVLAPHALRVALTIAVSVVALGGLGYLGATLGGARPLKPVLRVVIGGAVAMAITMGIGSLVGAAV
ncbi:MAG: VIT family protein [Deltaproteobacteria bacterium]|nr:VIT family protein [Deltaproteobacteria bacterium]